LRKAVEQIAREMDGPRALADIVQEAVARSGRPQTKHTPRTVADALARLPFIIRCGEGTYAPVRIALDGKKFRVPLTADDIAAERLSKARLEPFYTALGEPRVCTEDGQELAPIYLSDEVRHMIRAAAVKVVVETLRELPWTDELYPVTDLEAMLWEKGMEQPLPPMISDSIDLSPLRLTASRSGAETEGAVVELIVRWSAQDGILIAKVAPPAESDDADAMAAEDRILADFIASKLPRNNALPLGGLLLEAYARFDGLGRVPGSAPLDVIRQDPRMRLIDGSELRPGLTIVARADMLTPRERRIAAGWDEPDLDDEGIDDWAEDVRRRIREHPRKMREAWDREWRRLELDRRPSPSNVVPIRKPSHEELIKEWDEALRQQGLSDRVRQRKVDHVDTLAWYLESDSNVSSTSHLLDVNESFLESFFFWTYIRKFPGSPSDAVTFTVDLRDFYRHQERLGRVADARFAELIHRLRHLIVERMELYEELLALPVAPDYDELFELLFIGE